MQTYDWNQVSTLRRERIQAAEDIVRRMNRGESFYDWLVVGEGLKEWRDAALELTGSQEMDTPAYRAAHRTAAPLYPTLAAITDKSERSYAIWMAENRENLEIWHAGLSDKQRRQWNHPRSVYRHSPLGQAMRAAEQTTNSSPGDARKKRGQAAEIENATIRLHEAAEAIERHLAPDLISMLDFTAEHIEATAETLISIYGEPEIRRLYEELGRRFAKAPKKESAALDPMFAASLNAPLRQRRSKERARAPSPEHC